MIMSEEELLIEAKKDCSLDVLGHYKNGNHYETIFSDGTKIKQTIDSDADHFTYTFPTNFDIHINNRCNAGCKYCHENSTKNGPVPSLVEFTESKLFETLKPGTEIAIGGGNIFESSDLEFFLDKLKSKGVIANVTINQKHIQEYKSEIKKFIENNLVHGIGISMTKRDKDDFKLIDTFGDNVVIHTINGILEFEDIPYLIGRKVLILGYKDLRRGHNFLKENESIKKNSKWLKRFLPKMESMCKLISFDCLGIEQLDPKNTLGINIDNWNLLFQGSDTEVLDSDGNITCATMYVDLCGKTGWECARMSTAALNKRFHFEKNESVEDVFKKSIKDW